MSKNTPFRYNKVDSFLAKTTAMLNATGDTDILKVVKLYVRDILPEETYRDKPIAGSKTIQLLRLFELKVAELNAVKKDPVAIALWITVCNLYYAEFEIIINKYRGECA